MLGCRSLSGDFLQTPSDPQSVVVLSVQNQAQNPALYYTLLYSSRAQTLSPHQKDQIHLYVHELLQWNQRMNLTAVTEASKVMERHVEGSLAIVGPIRSSYLSRRGSSSDSLSLVDVGSGWEVTLIESMNKRCVFLEHVIGHAGLSNVQVVRGRAEDRILGRVSRSKSSLMWQLLN